MGGAGQKKLKASEVIDYLLINPIPPERDVAQARETYAQLARECVWSGKPLSRKFEVDHVIPFSLWRNNDLWNLLPVLPEINNAKRDRLPTRVLLIRRKESIVGYWSILQSSHQLQFDYDASRLTGLANLPENWQNLVFQSVAEAVEFTAIQRGCERWEPA